MDPEPHSHDHAHSHSHAHEHDHNHGDSVCGGEEGGCTLPGTVEVSAPSRQEILETKRNTQPHLFSLLSLESLESMSLGTCEPGWKLDRVCATSAASLFDSINMLDSMQTGQLG